MVSPRLFAVESECNPHMALAQGPEAIRAATFSGASVTDFKDLNATDKPPHEDSYPYMWGHFQAFGAESRKLPLTGQFPEESK